jgi:hypothetical protein
MFDLLEASPMTVSLPDRLASLPPGADLAAVLSRLDRDLLTGEDRVALLQARSRLKAHVEAEMMADMISIIDAEYRASHTFRPMEDIHALAAAEIQAALTWTRRASEHQLSFAWTMVTDFSRVWEALRGGLIDLPKARVIADQTSHLDSDTRDRVVDIALERAPTQTTGLLAARIRRLAMWVDPDNARKRYENGLADRLVASEANDDGTANLVGMHMSAPDTQAAMRRINRLARGLKRSGDSRTIDQIRADIFLDLLRGGHESGGKDRAVVDINVDLPTLLRLAENPGELPGFGPVVSDIARQVVEEQEDAEWRYTVTDESGAVVSNGTTRRRPDAEMKRRIESRVPTCAFPGCRMPANECDIDHNRGWVDGGPTVDSNLAPLCRHHHVIKHQGWTITQLEPGRCRLISPLGLVYVTGPEPP